jgi:hypothetical protein
MFRFTTNVTSLPTTCWRNEFASAATTSKAGPSAVAIARDSTSRQPTGSRSADRGAASTSQSTRSGALAANSATVSQSPNALPRSLRAIRQGCKPLYRAMQLLTWSCGTESVYNLL